MSSYKFHFGSVLLVDDSEIDILVNRRLIELTFFASEIYVTTNGEEAINFLRNECNSSENIPDWIFLDMHLPVMSGFDFIEEFKTLPEYITSKSRIIILSVFQKQEHLKKVLECKFIAGQLDKPLTQQALKNLMSTETSRITSSS